MAGRTRWSERAPALGWAALALVLLSTATLATAAIVDAAAVSTLRGQDQILAEQLGQRIAACVRTRVGMVEAMRHEWDLGALRSDTAFAARAESLLLSFPGYLAINRVDASGVIVHVHPPDPNAPALHRSVADQPFAVDAFRGAMKSGTPRLTAAGELFQGGTGMAVYVPFEARDGALNGVFRADVLIPACLGEVPALHGYQVRDGNTVVFADGPKRQREDHAMESAAQVLNRTWTVRLLPTDGRVAAAQRPARWLRALGLSLSVALSGLLGLMLTLRRRAQAREVRSAEEMRRLVALIDAASDFVSITAPSGRIEYLNPAGQRMLGTDVEAEVQKVAVVHEEDRATYQAHLARLAATGTSRVEIRLVNRQSGETTPVELNSFLLDGPPGQRSRATVGRDLREHRRLELQLNQAQKMEALGRLAGGVAHDFNNLLTVIQAGVTLLQRDPNASDRAEVITEIEEAGQRAAALTRQLLALGRGTNLERQEVDVGEVVANLHNLFARLVRSDVVLDIRTPEGPTLVLGNTTQLEQVVVNLVMNGIDAMPRGGSLRLEVDADDEEVRLRVQDSGTGMKPEVASRIFEPFFTTKEPGRGTGLGLATVFGHVQAMGGRIEVDSAPGQGSRFTVRLPRLHERLVLPVAPPPSELGPLPRTVLLVENDAAVRSAVSRLLRHLGVQVQEVDSGGPAISLLSAPGAVPPDVVLSDVVMPEVGGVDLVKWLRAERPTLPVVLMSGYSASALDSVDLFALHVPLLHKPVSRTALESALRRALRTRTAA